MKSKPSSSKKNNKTVAKICPNCRQQVPVASKSCSCGHLFRKNSPSIPEESTRPQVRRRTERVRRERPEYFQSLEFINSVKPSRQQTASTSSNDDPPKRKRGRPRSKNKEEEINTGANKSPPVEPEVKGPKEEVDVFANVSADKALQYAIILAEINRKIVSQNFRPW